MTDFPVYDTGPMIGYLPSPNQQGNFLNKNRWSINEKSQCSPKWEPDKKPDVLVIGDSVVWGGNPLDDSNKLGYQLQNRLPDHSVWSAAAGSLAIPNLVAYTDRFPDVPSRMEHIIWVVNAGDYGERTQWATDRSHPRSRPLWGTWYLANKYVFFPILSKRRAVSKSRPPEVSEETLNLLRKKIQEISSDDDGPRHVIAFYSGKELINGTANMELVEREAKCLSLTHECLGGLCEIIVIQDDERWNDSLYRDAIHPSADGNSVLADILADYVNGP